MTERAWLQDGPRYVVEWEPLKEHGYAPGGYAGRCSKCGDSFTGDKRAWRCEPCAMAAELDRLRAENERLRAALEVPKVWTAEERDGMAEAFRHASEVRGRGHYETLFAVAAWLLRYRARAALKGPEKEQNDD